MSDLTAIDILVNPDEATLEHARKFNARMRQSVPDGFALDATHQPHITTLQRYVHTAELDEVYDAVERTIADTDIAALSYQAVAIGHADWGVPGQGLTGLVIKPSPQVLDFQARLLAAITPFIGSGGTARRSCETTARRSARARWTGSKVTCPTRSATNYIAHITVGFATLDDLKVIEAEPFDAFAVHPASVAVYHLGNSGTARVELKSWQL